MADFQKELLQQVINTIDDIIFVKDKQGRYILVNKFLADVYHTTVDNMIGKTDWDLIDEKILTKEKAERYTKADNFVLETGNEYFFEEAPLEKEDGTKIWIQTRKKPISIDGDSNYVLGVVQNITELKEKTLALQNYQEHIKLINKILRHDLTNSFIAIKSLLNLLEIKNEKKEQMLSVIEDSLKLLARMREMEKFISQHPQLEPFDLREVLNDSFKHFPEIGFEIKGNAKVFANETIYSVFDNLIRNAIIHGKADFISIEIITHNKTVIIKFADNGTGIPDEIKPKIFDESFKHGKTGHTGIGLFIVNKAVTSFGGYVYVEDNKPKGATFTIVLRISEI